VGPILRGSQLGGNSDKALVFAFRDRLAGGNGLLCRLTIRSVVNGLVISLRCQGEGYPTAQSATGSGDENNRTGHAVNVVEKLNQKDGKKRFL